MSDEGNPLQPEHVYKKVIWRSMLGLGNTMDDATTWSMTGVAAIVGLFISNLESVGELVSTAGLRWSLLLLTAALIFGALSKQFGMYLAKGLELIEKVEGILSSEQGQALLGQIQTEPKKLIDETAEPFWWPLSWMMRRGGRKGMSDYLSADKRLISLFCTQMALVYMHGIAAAAGLVVVSVSIMKP